MAAESSVNHINIKMRKKTNSNSDIIDFIKNADELCVKVFLFSLFCENPAKADIELMKKSSGLNNLKDADIINALDFWRDRKILSYEIILKPDINLRNGGASMDSIIEMLTDIKRDISIMNDEREAESGEIAKGLGIYEEREEVRIETEPEEPEEEEVIEITGITEEVPAAVKEIEIDKIDNKNISKNKSESKSKSVSIDELCESLETDNNFNKLIHEAQIKMQTVFNMAELTVIYNLYKNEGIEPDLILKIIGVNISNNKNNLAYIEKDALGNAANGILTLDGYEEKMREIYKIIEFEKKIIKLFNIDIKAAKFKPKEKKLIREWARDFDFPDDVLLEGYKRCMDNIEKLSLEYINTIYINWHRKNLRTIEEVKGEFKQLPDYANKTQGKKNTGYDIEQWYEKALRTSMDI
ncbi:MAG: DnaD domain protein [Oscillospiraceae bacterium]|nr:DnaD domain protein [Oscillospiraceae bacterium]